MNGINVVGYFNGKFGLAEAVRLNSKALKSVGVSVSEIDYEKLKQNDTYKYDINYSVNLVQISLNDIDEFFSVINPEFFKKKYTILYLIWESEHIPNKLRNAINLFNEVWTSSDYCKTIFSKIYDRPIIIVPHPIEVKFKPINIGNKLIVKSKEKFRFLFIFNYHSSVERKNPFHLIKAFIKAFEQNENVELIIKTSSAKDFKKIERELYNSIKGQKNIGIIDIDLDQNSIYNLINNCDCYVSLHHSEGFGLTLAEAMYLGKPTIASNYSGNTEYMNQYNSYLVDCKIGKIENPDAIFSKETIWGYPILEDTINKMKLVYENDELRKEKSLRAEKELKTRLSYTAIGNVMSNRLKYLYINQEELAIDKKQDIHLLNQLQILNAETSSLRKENRRLKKNIIVKVILFIKNKVK